MKNWFFILILMQSFVFAQTHRFMYEYHFAPDSTQIEEVKKENMILDITEKGSTYQSYDNYVTDSLMHEQFEKARATGSRNFNFNRSERSAIRYRVTKQYPEFKVYLHERFSSEAYKVLEDEKLNWNILPETEKIGTYQAQKATANFGGRIWTAWFTTDLPFQDGPYKFHGLPGLIIKVEDKTGTHRINLVGNKILRDVMKETTEPNVGGRGFGFGMGSSRELEIDEKKFKSLWKEYVNDPSKSMRERMMQNTSTERVSFRMRTPDGREISDPNEVYRMMEKRVKDDIAKNNNRIEPSLYR